MSSLNNSADTSRQRMHFCAALTKARGLIAPAADRARLSPTLARLLPAGPARKTTTPAALARVHTSDGTYSFHVHPAASEAALHICFAHPAAAHAGLRVAAKVDAARVDGLTVADATLRPWAIGLPSQGGKFNAHRLLRDGIALAASLDGVETRRLVTERPKTQQPRYDRSYITVAWGTNN